MNSNTDFKLETIPNRILIHTDREAEKTTDTFMHPNEPAAWVANMRENHMYCSIHLDWVPNPEALHLFIAPFETFGSIRRRIIELINEVTGMDLHVYLTIGSHRLRVMDEYDAHSGLRNNETTDIYVYLVDETHNH